MLAPLRGLLYVGISLVALMVFAWVVFREIIDYAARQKAVELLDAAGVSSDSHIPDAAVETLTKLVHLAKIRPRFRPVLVRLRPYLTHRLLPASIRVSDGAIDLIYLSGDCDNIARGLNFVLRRAGLPATQINLVTPRAAHSAVITRLGNREVLLDPFFGIVAKYEGRLLDPAEARSLARRGVRAETVWYRLDPSSDPHFYDQFANSNFAAQGEPLEIFAELQLPKEGSLQLGKKNAASEDVSRDAAAAGLTPYWHYLGSRYDRRWIRKLHFHEAARVEVGLVEKPARQFITSEQIPELRERTLVYHMKAGETLVFQDGKAGYDWFRLRSYQDVDYIRFSSG